MIVLSSVRPVAENEKGRDYSRPTTGTDMPTEERFRHARLGVLSSAILCWKLSVSLWTAAKARKLGFDQNYILIRFLAEQWESNINGKQAQADSHAGAGEGRPRGARPEKTKDGI
jgi:hypothetical protein